MKHKTPELLLKLFNPGNRNARLTAAMIGLGTGFLLGLLALLVWINFKHLLAHRTKADSIAEYLIIGKKITDDNMGRNRTGNRFTEAEIRELEEAPGVVRVGRLQSNRFPVRARLGGNLGFQTELFLEAAPEAFMDVLPEDWTWTSGDAFVPVMLSSEFLNLYNYGFALSQGLPQLSRTALQAVPFRLEIKGGERVFQAKVTGFSDRISSVLVPETFLKRMNLDYSEGPESQPARLILNVRDPSASAFISFLDERQYTVGAEQLRWNAIRSAVSIIVSVVGIVALLIIGMALLSLLLFLEVTIYRSAENIRLLKQLGYTPRRLKQGLNRYFLSRMLLASSLALILALGFQLFLVRYSTQAGLDLGLLGGWPALVLFPVWMLILYAITNRAALRIIYKL